MTELTCLQVISDQVLAILAADNLDVACAAIEKAAMERAVSDVDEGFAASYEARRRHREVSQRRSFRRYLHLTSPLSFVMGNHSGTHRHHHPTLP